MLQSSNVGLELFDLPLKRPFLGDDFLEDIPRDREDGSWVLL